METITVQFQGGTAPITEIACADLAEAHAAIDREFDAWGAAGRPRNPRSICDAIGVIRIDGRIISTRSRTT